VEANQRNKDRRGTKQTATSEGKQKKKLKDRQIMCLPLQKNLPSVSQDAPPMFPSPERRAYVSSEERR